MKKIVLVIGGSSGIGYEICKQLNKDFYNVYNASRSPCKINKINNIYLDLYNKNSIDNLIKKFINIDIDFLIYCAGVSLAALFEQTREDDYRYLFEINFFGLSMILSKILPKMQKVKDGRVIVISSLASIFPVPYDPFYNASKGAINNLIESLNHEYNKNNIYLSSILPGGVKTAFTFKRKITTNNNATFIRQVNNLAKTEQNGINPKVIAKIVIKNMNKEHPPIIIIPAIKNKMLFLINKIIPNRLKNVLLDKYFNRK